MPLLLAIFCLHLLFLHPVAIAEAFSVSMYQGGDESLRAGFIGKFSCSTHLGPSYSNWTRQYSTICHLCSLQ